MNLYVFNDASGRSNLYGIGTYIRELTQSLRNYALNLTVVHLFSEKSDLTRTEQEGIQHWYIPSHQKNESGGDEISNVYQRNVVYLLRLHIPKNTGKIIFHLNYNHGQILADELKRNFDCKIVWTGHFQGWGFSLHGNIAHLRSILSKPQEEMDNVERSVYSGFQREQKLMQTVDRIISLSSHMKKVLCDEYGIDAKQISVIPNGLTDTAHGFPVDKARLRAKWKFRADEKLILFAGRLDTVKGLTYLIRAFREVLVEMPGCRLLVVGDGPYNIYLKESIDICAKITYAGLIPQPQLFELYHTADIGVVPSLYEPFGYVAVEMMMHGLPLIATETSGLNELVEDGKCGLKVPVRFGNEKEMIDIKLLAQKILFLLQNPDESDRLKNNARKRYEKMYTIETMGKNMFNFYDSLYI